MMRILLFLATNFAVMLVLGIILNVTGIAGNSTGGILIMAMLFGFAGSAGNPPFSAEYLQGTGNGCGMLYSEQWLSEEMGRPGSTAFKYSPYSQGASGRIPSGKRLGTVYGCDHSGSECAGSSDCVYVVGTSGAEQNTDAYKSKAPDLKGTASKSAFRVSRVLWMQTFQSGKSVSKRTWNRAD